MLVAEAHGKGFPEARNREDYLTSAVFGHLRYLPPTTFWETLFSHAKGLDPNGMTLKTAIDGSGTRVSQYGSLRVRFWAKHAVHGEPDLLLCFSRPDVKPLLVLIEVKLWATKSGTGERDQLVRYLRILDSLGEVGFPENGRTFLVYLTPKDSTEELEESASLLENQEKDRGRIFSLQWQDVLLAAKECEPDSIEPAKTILADVTSFLRRLGLEYFDGFSIVEELSDDFGELPYSPTSLFQGFAEVSELQLFVVMSGRWMQ